MRNRSQQYGFQRGSCFCKTDDSPVSAWVVVGGGGGVVVVGVVVVGGVDVVVNMTPIRVSAGELFL